jgi:hypothetical protein
VFFILPIIRDRAERILSSGVFFLALCATYGVGVRSHQKVEAAINQPSLAHLKQPGFSRLAVTLFLFASINMGALVHIG